jgi:hypothetical protein
MGGPSGERIRVGYLNRATAAVTGINEDISAIYDKRDLRQHPRMPRGISTPPEHLARR